MDNSLALTMENVLRNDTACRICLVQGEAMQALFVEGTGIIEQIEYCTGIRLLNEPTLPSHICPPCLTHLSIAHSFKSTCLSSHHTLHPHAQTLVNTDVKIERDDDWVKEERKSKRVKMKKEKEDRNKNRKPHQAREYIYTENNRTMYVNIGNSFTEPSIPSISSDRIPGDSVLREKTPKKRSKKGSADASNWEINRVKKARESGRAYLSQKRLKGIKVGFETRKERKMGPPCCSNLCRKSAKRRCDIIKDKDRKYCFNKFWGLNWTDKKQYIVDLVDVINCKKVNGESRRTKTIKYNLEVNNECWPVCKKMFLNTLSLGEKTVLGWLEKACEQAAMSNTN
ncbi:uncharacterized protein LOC133531622 isoform X2 [Cydia pomonella]|uniref:uncharacterized protein LOC133531622 isoform X2 n=1 Tax=Cydia pomonella TaxID=82600 RepID=UPI002ADDEA16|nr:uncharacterized protein LOC133531622 isoform X2 [Cydia pomonella]